MRVIEGDSWVKRFIISILVLGTVCHGLTSDGEVLLSFKKALNDSDSVLLNWNATDSDPCLWSGVRCGFNSTRVHWLVLPYHHLRGSLSAELGKLNELRKLKLHENKFDGPIPAELGNLFSLRELYLRGNSLSNSIPSSLGQLGDLEYLDFSRNDLTGAIPNSLGKLSKLRFLNLSANLLVGEIPSEGILENLTSSSFMGNVGLCGPQINELCQSAPLAPGPQLLSPSPVSVVAAAPCLGSASTERTDTPHPSPKLLSALLISITALGVLIGLSSFWGCYLCRKHRLRTKGFEQVKTVVSSKLVMFHGDLPYASRDVIKKIEMLDDTDVIGSGGFGTVYRLVMDDGCWFAVKKIGKFGISSERLFERELEILGSFKHRNLVNLRGYCNSPHSKLLIYDYLPYGSLDEFLHEREPHEPPLTWTQRLNIAIGAGRALAYLHHDCCPRIIHRDIKSSNILLDDQMEPHVSDFGLAKLVDDNDSHVTTIVAGTFGYLAPEYMHSGRATEKGDVYSYGVVLLELLSGKRPTDPSFTEKGLNVVGWVSTRLRENRQKDVFDTKCPGAQKESMENMLQVALMCIAANPDDRPTMEQVVQMLEADTFTPCPSDHDDFDSFAEDDCRQALV